jgi:hypothetical protein
MLPHAPVCSSYSCQSVVTISLSLAKRMLAHCLRSHFDLPYTILSLRTDHNVNIMDGWTAKQGAAAPTKTDASKTATLWKSMVAFSQSLAKQMLVYCLRWSIFPFRPSLCCPVLQDVSIMDGKFAMQGAASPIKTKASKTATHWINENQQANKTIYRTHAWLIH